MWDALLCSLVQNFVNKLGVFDCQWSNAFKVKIFMAFMIWLSKSTHFYALMKIAPITPSEDLLELRRSTPTGRAQLRDIELTWYRNRKVRENCL